MAGCVRIYAVQLGCAAGWQSVYVRQLSCVTVQECLCVGVCLLDCHCDDGVALNVYLWDGKTVIMLACIS